MLPTVEKPCNICGVRHNPHGECIITTEPVIYHTDRPLAEAYLDPAARRKLNELADLIEPDQLAGAVELSATVEKVRLALRELASWE